MSSFKERLAAAKVAPRKTVEVQVVVDEDLSNQREELKDALEKARVAQASDPRLTGEDPAIEELQEKLDEILALSAEALVTLRFTKLKGDDWTSIAGKHPARLEYPIDRQYGYDMHGATKEAAAFVDAAGVAYGGRVEGDVVVPLEVTTREQIAAGATKVDEWADLFGVISGHEMSAIMEAVYSLNEYDPAVRVGELKNELATRPA
jgi:DNA-directed RNA polymerase subunit H (RpoH/RPB5)